MDFHFNGNVGPRAKDTENISTKIVEELKLFMASETVSDEKFKCFKTPTSVFLRINVSSCLFNFLNCLKHQFFCSIIFFKFGYYVCVGGTIKLRSSGKSVQLIITFLFLNIFFNQVTKNRIILHCLSEKKTLFPFLVSCK